MRLAVEDDRCNDAVPVRLLSENRPPAFLVSSLRLAGLVVAPCKCSANLLYMQCLYAANLLSVRCKFSHGALPLCFCRSKIKFPSTWKYFFKYLEIFFQVLGNFTAAHARQTFRAQRRNFPCAAAKNPARPDFRSAAAESGVGEGRAAPGARPRHARRGLPRAKIRDKKVKTFFISD